MFSFLYAADTASAQSQPDLGYTNILFMAAIFAVFYFLMIRPNIKRQKELDKKRKALQKGDKIITAGGIIAKVERVKDNNTVQVKIADNVSVEIVLSTILEVISDKVEKAEKSIKKPSKKEVEAKEEDAPKID